MVPFAYENDVTISRQKKNPMNFQIVFSLSRDDIESNLKTTNKEFHLPGANALLTRVSSKKSTP